MVLVSGEFSADIEEKNIQQADTCDDDPYQRLRMFAVGTLRKSSANDRKQAAMNRCGCGFGIHRLLAIVSVGQIKKFLTESENCIELGVKGVNTLRIEMFSSFGVQII